MNLTTATRTTNTVLGVRTIRQPPTIPQAVTHISKSLLTGSSTAICCSLAAAIGLVSPPTFIETTQFTNPSRINSRKESTLLGCQADLWQHSAIKTYLLQHPAARQFVLNAATIIDEVYGENTMRRIQIVDDLDTGKPIMELTIYSELPINDEFFEKDLRFFQKIASSEEAQGSHDVIITQG